MADGSPDPGLRALVAPLSRGAAATPQVRRLLGAGVTLDEEPREPPATSASDAPSRFTGVGRTRPRSGCLRAHHHGRALDVLDRQAKTQGDKPSIIPVKPTLTWPTFSDSAVL